MSDFFPESMPNQNLSSEEKRQIARRFRRKANLTDFCCLLSVALFLLGTALRGSPSIANFLFAVCPLRLLRKSPPRSSRNPQALKAPISSNRGGYTALSAALK